MPDPAYRLVLAKSGELRLNGLESRLQKYGDCDSIMVTMKELDELIRENAGTRLDADKFLRRNGEDGFVGYIAR